MKLILIWLLALAVARANSEYSNNIENGNISLNYRLPNETYPEHYEIIIDTTYNEGGRRFNNNVLIDIAVTNSTKRIILNALKLNISKITIEEMITRTTEELEYEYDLKKEFLILTRINGKQFPALTKWKLQIQYSLIFDGTPKGIIEYRFPEKGKNVRNYLETDFENSNARRALPCYDEPGKQANFTITIYHNANLRAISNMPVNKDLSSKVKTVFLTTPRISINTVGFVVSNFDFAEENTTDITQRVYFRRGVEHNVRTSLSYGETMLKFMQDYTGVKFMLPKLDYVALPRSFAEFTANLGLITYPETALEYNADIYTAKHQIPKIRKWSSLVSQQWFGGYVSIQWWSDFWLRAGLGDLFINKALIKNFPHERILDFTNYDDYNSVLADPIPSKVPLVFYGQTPSEIRKLNKNFPFSRNTFFLLMWNNALTDDVFRKAIEYFLKQNQYSAVVGEHFFAAIQHAADELNCTFPAPIGQMMSTWIHQGSYPLLTITRDYTTGSFHVKQQPFHSDETFKGNTWYVPINYATASNHDFNDTKATHYLLNVTETEVNATIFKEDWLLLNKQSTGLYRVKYDEKNYQLLTKSLLTGKPFKIPARDRAQLLRDTYYWSSANQLNQSIYLDMLTYLKHEDHYLPWMEVIKFLIEYNRHLSDDDDYKWFVKELFSPIFAKTGVNDSPNDDDYDKELRLVVLRIACLFGVEECLVQTNNKLKAVLNGSVVIEPNLEYDIYCNGLIQSGDEEFQLLYKKPNTTKNSSEREQLISYLSCSRNRAHIVELISPYTDNSDEFSFLNVLGNICTTSKTAALACMDHLSENLERLDKYFDVYTQISEDVFSEEVRQKFLNLSRAAIQENADLATELSDLSETNIEEEEKYRKNIIPWIKKYRASQENSPSTAN